MLAGGLTAASVGAAETLPEALAAAYLSNPTLMAQQATQRAVDETYVQARAGWRPTLSLGSTALFQETRTPRAARQFGQPAVTRGNQGSATLNFSQPAWTGGRTASAVSAATADVLAGRENLRRIETQILQSVITAYVDVLRDQQTVNVRTRQVEALTAQLDESRARFDAGDITRTDVALSQARLSGALAQLESSRAQLAISGAGYAALVGRNPDDLAPAPSLKHMLPPSAEEAFRIAEAEAPTLRQQESAERASRARVAGARAERMPSITLQGSVRYGNAPVSPFQPGAFDQTATAGATFNLPLQSGGLTSSRIRQAIERNNVDRINVEGQRRSLLQSLVQAWNQFEAAQANIATSAQTVRAATIALEGTREEERAGLRDTRQVLNAEQELRNAELQQVNALRDEYVATATILALMGRLEARHLLPSTAHHDAAANFRSLRLSWGWVPWEVPVALFDRATAIPPIPKPDAE